MIIMDFSKYFSNNYLEARYKFREACKKAKLNSYSKEVIDGLTIDFATSETKKKDKLIILMSGTHGVEGYIGSATQLWFIEKILPKIKSKTSIGFVHCLNPFGMQHNKRYNENNVDLNRNCIDNLKNIKLIDPKSTLIIKEAQKLLTPKRPRVNEIFEWVAYYFLVKKIILRNGLKNTIKAVSFGQNLFPKSVCYCGKEKQKSIIILEDFIKKITKDYNKVIFIDIHTGTAKKYNTKLFTKNKKESKEYNFIKKIKRIKNAFDTKRKGTNYIGGVENILFKNSKAKENIDLILEYGTIYRFSILFSINRLSYLLVKDNQITNYGPVRKFKKIRNEIKKAYYPNTKKYKKFVISASNKLFNKIINKFINY